MHFDIHCQACASYVRVRVWVGVRVSVESSYLFNQARCTDVSARSLCLLSKVFLMHECSDLLHFFSSELSLSILHSKCELNVDILYYLNH